MSANNQGTRGGPGRGGVASRPMPKQLPRRLLNRMPAGGGQPQLDATAGADLGGGMVGRNIGGVLTRPRDMVGGAPVEPMGGVLPDGRPGGMIGAPPKPAWQQIREMGGQGTGTPAGNRARLAEMLAARGGGAPPMPGGDGPAVQEGIPGADIGSAISGLRQQLGRMGPLAGGAGGLMARPLPGRMAQPPAAPGGEAPPQARPMPGQVISDPSAAFQGAQGAQGGFPGQGLGLSLGGGDMQSMYRNLIAQRANGLGRQPREQMAY